MRNLRYAVLLLTGALYGCSNPSAEPLCGSDTLYPLNANSIVRIQYGTSFGFCVGYCRKWIEAAEGGVSYTKTGWQGEVPVSCTAPFPCTVWVAKWSNLTSAIDIDAFFALDEVIGCPDCTDGGAEWVEIETSRGRRHKVTFGYGIPPDAVKPFHDILGELKESFNECN